MHLSKEYSLLFLRSLFPIIKSLSLCLFLDPVTPHVDMSGDLPLIIGTGLMIIKAMDEEGDRLVGVKGPMPSCLMSIFVCNICKVR
jgi:hypothetical protein